MKKVTKPHNPEESSYVFTEGINYFEAGRESIWGSGEKETLAFLDNLTIRGKWLNLAAGDGRYNYVLLEKAASVTVSDIDEGALSKLWHSTPKTQRAKLSVKVFDITKAFPFDETVFDGVFSTGTLHLFSDEVLSKIVAEVNRILKPGGQVIIDFATNIKRESPEGNIITFGNEPLYSLEEGKRLLAGLFKSYAIDMREGEFSEEFQGANPPYKMSCTFILLMARKN